MIISPPFLTHPNNSGNDESWIDWMMPVDQFRNYPINLRGSWHGGIHISYTNAEDKIRAIADGTVVYVRMPSSVEKRDSAPLNYNGPTDDGCVVIKHETEIGDGESGKVTYWSVYMHLNEIEGRVTQGSKIYRKDVLGTPGLADGDKEFHFQIFSDDENTKKLTGREELESETDLTKDGRTHVVYGDIHFYLPVGTIFYDKIPENNSAETTGLSPVYTSIFPLFVTMKFYTGNCEMVTRMKKEVSEGEIDEYVYETVGEALINKDGDKYEYNLYKTAMKLYPQRPSSGFELLRFGRVINSEHEVLTPSNAPLWRTVNYPGGHGVVNLADPNIKKYSDGDFPHWIGWRLVDDDVVHDSQCHSDTINNWKGSKHFASSCQRAICRFNQEWEASSLEERFDWLLVEGEDEFSRRKPMKRPDWDKLLAHARALCISGDLPAGRVWHFDPRTFISHFRKCGWLALDEVASLLPRVYYAGYPGHPQTDSISFQSAKSRWESYYKHFNRCCNKYLILNVNRKGLYLGQIYTETAMMRTMTEFGRGYPKNDGTWTAPAMEYYQAFYGRGMMQLTWAGNYEEYKKFQSDLVLSNLNQSESYTDNRITHDSLHYWGDPRRTRRNRHTERTEVYIDGTLNKNWYPYYDPNMISSSEYLSTDSAGFFWVSKQYRINSEDPSIVNINRCCDSGINTESIGLCSKLVNGGGFQYFERQAFSRYTYKFLSDDIINTQTETIQITRNRQEVNVVIDYTRQC